MGTPANRHVALMRGVNVGGKNKLMMRDLAGIFEAAGCADVETYIQSGNVVFTATPTLAATIPARIAKQVEARFSIRSPVITRSAKEFDRLIRAMPYSGKAATDTFLHVAFLADKPTRVQAAALDPNRSKGDTFRLIGREIYLSLPNGVARTKLTNAYFDTALDTVSTMRNWRTVQRLGAMLGIDP
jgi:uncharacterized protein (DUF1697 family)